MNGGTFVEINTNQTRGAIHRCSNKRCSSCEAFHNDDVLLTPTRVYNIRSKFTLYLSLTLCNTVTSFGYGPLLRQSPCLYPPVSLTVCSSLDIHIHDIIFTRVGVYLVTCHSALLHLLPPKHSRKKKPFAGKRAGQLASPTRDDSSARAIRRQRCVAPI